jgi:hypothetical protein
LKLLDLAPPAQLQNEGVLHSVWKELLDQIKAGGKLTDADQKTKLRQALQTVLGKNYKLPEDDPGLVKELHRFFQMQPERSDELVKALNDAKYTMPSK